MITLRGVRISSHERSKPIDGPVLPKLHEIVDASQHGIVVEIHIVLEDYKRLLDELKLSPFDVVAGVTL